MMMIVYVGQLKGCSKGRWQDQGQDSVHLSQAGVPLSRQEKRTRDQRGSGVGIHERGRLHWSWGS